MDAGCGVGYFSEFLAGLGLQVTGVEGRAENVQEARRRYPKINFVHRDMEHREIKQLGPFDLVLCFGLLYHLENPFMAVRNLHALTAKVLLVESMVTPGRFPSLELVDEVREIDQSLRYSALRMSRSCLTGVLYRSGFVSVYGARPIPRHEDFQKTILTQPRRIMMMAAKTPLEVKESHWMREPVVNSPKQDFFQPYVRRASRFLFKPWPEKLRSLCVRFKRLWNHLFAFIPLPVRLHHGSYWLARNDVQGDLVFLKSYEYKEQLFVENFLQDGMTVLDIGAHHGLYTLLASKKVGPSGKVISFEPSQRDRRTLWLHLRINRCRNVKVETFALSDRQGKEELFIVNGRDSGCNSLRPPAVSEAVYTTFVDVVSLDHYLKEKNIGKVDFVKMDAEGAELKILQGGEQTLIRDLRPVILLEMQNLRTLPWGYTTVAIYDYLSQRGYVWFKIVTDGQLSSCSKESMANEQNLVSIPKELFNAPGRIQRLLSQA